MTTIKRGSLFLTDDFVQALSYAVPAQFSGYALLNLPKWSEDSMYLNSAEVGLPAGTVDPNVILPAVFSQYWLNLCAYARQYHAQLGYGEDIEDFTEQGFWKMLKRLHPDNTPMSALEQYIIAKSTDVIVNTNSVEGNLYTELLISVNAKLTKQTISLKESKPTYMQTVAKLPDSENPLVLGGHALALYDRDKNYYDLSDSECVVADMKSESEVAEFTYNAVLLYYSLNDVVQVAGIYFPNAYTVDSDGKYRLPDIVKKSDTSLGYSINIRYAAGLDYDYQAANADLGAAMQIYNSWYKAITNANYQIDKLSLAVMEQGKEIDSIKSMFDGGFLLDLYKQVTSLKQQVATTFKGSVSTNKLLELFLAAKSAQNNLTLSMSLSDLSKTVLAKDIEVSNPIGIYKDKDIIQMGTSITEIIAGMLTGIAPVIYTAPSGSMMIDGQAGTIYMDYNTTGNLSIAILLTQADAGAFVLPAVVTVTENGQDTSLQLQNVQETLTYPMSAPISNVITASMIVQYSEGPIKPGDTTGFNRIFAGLLSLDIRIVPVYDAYLGSIQLLEQLNNIDPTDLSAYRKVKSNELDTIVQGQNDYQVLIIPSNTQNPIVNLIAGKHDLTINSMQYTAYAVQTKILAIDTTNLR